MSDIGSDDLETYAERTGIPLTAPTAEPERAEPPAAEPTPDVLVVGEAITLDLGSGTAAWDDSELVNAWDAAAEEFRLHNPGPGTWLDKATAALAIGKPLPGATHGESNVIRTRWYTETPPAKPTFVNPYAQPTAEGTSNSAYTEPPSVRKKSTVRTNLKRKRKREEVSRNATFSGGGGTGSTLADEVGSVDMELDEDDSGPNAVEPPDTHTPQSPAYTPASPLIYPSAAPHPEFASQNQKQHGPALPDRISRARQSGSRNPYLPASHTHAQPPRAATPTYAPGASGMYPEMGATAGAVPLTKEEASTRAVNAQWWAGYWFAMSEVMPSVAQLEQTQSQLQR